MLQNYHSLQVMKPIGVFLSPSMGNLPWTLLSTSIIRTSNSTKAVAIHVGAIVALLIFLSPHFINVDEARFLIHDNLNSNVVWNTQLTSSANVFSLQNEQIEGILNRLPSGLYRQEFTYISLLYSVFKPLTAYNLNAIFIHLVAYLSSLAFIRSTFKSIPLSAAVGISLSFAFLPFRTAAMMSIAAQPLIALCVYNLSRDRMVRLSWVLLFIFPFFSDLFLANTFSIMAMGVYAVYTTIMIRSISRNLLLGILLLVLGSVLVHYKLFELILFEGFQSQRGVTRVVSDIGLNLFGLIGTSITTALKGQYHFHTYPYLLTLPFIAVGLIVSMVNKQAKPLVFSVGALFLIGLLNQIWFWQPIELLIREISFIKTFNFRFYSLIPFFTYLCIVVSVSILLQNKLGKILCYISITSLILMNFFPILTSDANGSEYLESTFYNTHVTPYSKEHKTFDEYYRPDIFQDIKAKLVPEFHDTKIACFAFDPAIAQMNGIYTVDGYFGIYPKQYFEKWAEMLHDESGNNFISWGNQCYLFSDELGENSKTQVINHLKIRPELLKDIGAIGILSRLPIKRIGDQIIDPKVIHTGDPTFKSVYYYSL